MWLVAVLVGLLAVGSGTAVGAQTSPAPTPSPSVVPSTEVTTDDYAAGDEPRDVDEPAPISDDVMGPAAEGVIAPGPPKDSSKAATPQASLMAPAALTEASGPWQYWISSSNPATGQTMTPGQTVTYTLNARRSTGDNGAAVTGAVVTMGLTGGATFTSVSGAGGNNGTVTLNGSTLTWQGMNLNGTGNTQTTRTVTVTATVDPLVLTGSLVGTVSPGATNGAFWSGAGRTQSVTHPVLGPGVCNFADPGSGAFAQSICWFDLARYNPTQDRKSVV